jgi:hypothetical protein
LGLFMVRYYSREFLDLRIVGLGEAQLWTVSDNGAVLQ